MENIIVKKQGGCTKWKWSLDATFTNVLQCEILVFIQIIMYFVQFILQVFIKSNVILLTFPAEFTGSKKWY